MIKISVLIKHHQGPTGDVLLCRKGSGSWEFPSDRARVNETDEEAAERIAWEQLGMKIRVGKLTLSGHKNPQDGTVEHIACGNITHNTHTKCDWHNYYEAVDVWQTEPRPGTYDSFMWVHPSELGAQEFSGDDKNFMGKYDPWIKGETVPNVRMP
ncbi:MAG: NUDIX hydrolase [Oscillospiraceae bacterium]|jgi:8-oxo-dGTP pyrophosphatase MutT (NUDIX family)|nr:NUDIX hydrolase [Oscillospiraceae bacterium]